MAKTNKSETASLDGLRWWREFDRPPETALKTIPSGRLKGKSDINPQWRYKAMTEHFGPCGIGWAYVIDKLWAEPQENGEVLAFALVSLSVKDPVSDEWSKPIPGIGGSKQVMQERAGLHNSDECYKMAVTDALSVAMKALGVAADIYAGLWDGSKYRDIQEEGPKRSTKRTQKPRSKGKGKSKPASPDTSLPDTAPTQAKKEETPSGGDIAPSQLLYLELAKYLDTLRTAGKDRGVTKEWIFDFLTGTAAAKKVEVDEFSQRILAAGRGEEFFNWMISTLDDFVAQQAEKSERAEQEEE